MMVAFAVLLSVAMALLTSSHSFAVTSTNNTANTLKVSPVRSDIEILPGETKTVQVTVTNLTNADILVSPIENDFISGDENGTPALILDADKFASTHSLKRFMTPLTAVTIPANKAKFVSVIITVPKTAQAGGYFGAIRFAPTSPEGGAQVNLSGSVASLILLTVPGNAVEQLNLTEFAIQQNGKSNALFTTSDGLGITFRFENKGSVQLGPFGKITVQKGKNIVYEKDFNDQTPRDVILPDSARRWNVPLEKIDGFGKYTVSATLTYGSKNQTVDVTRTFWVIPVSYMIGAGIALLILIALVIFIIWFVRRKRQRHAPRSHSGGLSVGRSRR
ncbi:MAG: hypothetical protein JWO99_805 [Candidatus Saccharibacteria bacterium]|nr:hypothetical protein [Candidatus Saccharibacteria bacterium]